MLRRAALIILLVLTVGIALTVYTLYDPAGHSFFPKCMFKAATGLDCPGCGSQRAFHALLHGEVRAALGYNPLAVAAIPLIGVLLIPDRCMPRLQRFKRSPWLSGSILVIVVAWWILRNLLW